MRRRLTIALLLAALSSPLYAVTAELLQNPHYPREGDPPYEQGVLLSEPASVPIRIAYHTGICYLSPWSHDACPWHDFIPASGELLFLPGEIYKSFTITIVDDAYYEMNWEAFAVYIESSDVIITVSGLSVYILDNDYVPPAITATPSIVVEGDTGSTHIDYRISGHCYRYNATWPSSDDATLGVDFEFWGTNGGGQAAVFGDNEVEPDETFVAHGACIVPCCFGPTAVVTILDDDLGIRPSTVRLTRGNSSNVTIYVGGARTTDELYTLRSMPARVATVPESVTIPAGSLSAEFPIHALAGGNAEIVITGPRSRGGKMFSLPATVVEPKSLLFDPSTLSLRPGESSIVRIALKTPSATPLHAALTASDPSRLRVPPSVVVPGKFEIAALAAGPAGIHAALPPEFGTSTAYLAADVSNGDIPPLFLSLSPATGSIAGGTLVMIEGENLESGCGIAFGDKTVETTRSGCDLVAATPPHAEGAVDVTVICRGGTSRLSAAFTYVSAADPPAVISSIDPGSAAPGETITINGDHFRADDAIRFGDTAAVIVSSTPAAHDVIVPELPAGSVAIAIGDAIASFHVAEVIPPQIFSVTPRAAVAGAEVTIDGKGFRDGVRFAIGGIDAAIVSRSFNRAVLRAAGAPTGLTTIDIDGNIAAPFEVLADGISIAAITPALASESIAVRITGNGFMEGATVTFNGIPATGVVVIDHQTITAIAPEGPPGPARVVVTNPDGSSASLTGAFRWTSGR